MIPVVKANGRAELQLLRQLKERSGEIDQSVTAAVTEIIGQVKNCGDEAVREYTARFDGRAPSGPKFPVRSWRRPPPGASPLFWPPSPVRRKISAIFTNDRSSKAGWNPRKTASSWGSACGGFPAWGCTCRRHGGLPLFGAHERHSC